MAAEFDEKVLDLIDIDGNDHVKEGKNVVDEEEDFLDVLLSSKENMDAGREMLEKAVRTFGKQFSSGKIEGIVFNNLN